MDNDDGTTETPEQSPPPAGAGDLVKRESFELAPTASAAEKQFEIQSAIAIAKRFPRDEDVAFAKLMKACARLTFAEDAAYSYDRGGNTISGPSVYLAREAARVWGNVRHGLEVITDDKTTRTIRGWAWDVETNTKVSAEDTFAKLVQHKNKRTKVTEWVDADERELRELTNRRGAILVRNSILQVIPSDLIDDALSAAKTTIKSGAEKDPEGTRKRIILAFSELNVTPEMLQQKLGHPIAQCSPAQLAELRIVFKSIADGAITWAEYMQKNGGDRNGGEPQTKTEAKAQAEAAGGATATPAPPATEAVVPLPIDLKVPYKVVEVGAQSKKGEPFIVTVCSLGGVKVPLTAPDPRLYMSAVSAKQSGADVIVTAEMREGVPTLLKLEELA